MFRLLSRAISPAEMVNLEPGAVVPMPTLPPAPCTNIETWSVEELPPILKSAFEGTPKVKPRPPVMLLIRKPRPQLFVLVPSFRLILRRSDPEYWMEVSMLVKSEPTGELRESMPEGEVVPSPIFPVVEM